MGIGKQLGRLLLQYDIAMSWLTQYQSSWIEIVKMLAILATTWATTPYHSILLLSIFGQTRENA